MRPRSGDDIVVRNELYFAIPGDLAAATGGYGYDRQIISGLRQRGWTVHIVGLGEGFPFPDQQVLDEADAILKRIPKHQLLLIDGLALGVLPKTAQQLALSHHLIALVHHPLALESGLTEQQCKSLTESEHEALKYASNIIVTSPATSRLLSDDFKVASERITVICPGTDKATFAQGSKDEVIRLLSVGSLIPRKGFESLVHALATLKDLPWHLTIAGDTTRHPETTQKLRSEIQRFQLESHITLTGAVPTNQLNALYRQSDIFVLASLLEGYGMAYAEAIAHGLPVIGTTAGAIPDTVPAESGLLVKPGDTQALAQALRELMTSKEKRESLAEGARRVAAHLPTWDDSCNRFEQVLQLAAQSPMSVA